MHETPLITTLSVALFAALLGGLAAARLRIPLIVGYLIAGIAIGPFTPGYIADTNVAAQLAEIGVVLLMFNVGMHFSIEDLLRVWRIAIPGAAVQIGIATGLGAALGSAWGWSLASGIIFGLCLSVASTVVLLRALKEHDALSSQGGQIAVGWLLVEDLVMIFVLVILPSILAEGLSIQRQDPWALAFAIVTTFAKVSAFAVVILYAGPRVFPWLLKISERSGSRELTTLAIVTVSLGVAFSSAHIFGVSLALGSFFAGLVLNESEIGQRSASALRPFEDAFGVLFFVAVGMLFDPGTIIREPASVLAVVGIIVIGKSIAAALIIILFRYDRDVLITVSAALVQIGEFSFILAEIGKELALITAAAQQLIIAGALISITIHPLVFKWAMSWRIKTR